VRAWFAKPFEMTSLENKDIHTLVAASAALSKVHWEKKNAEQIVKQYEEARKALQRIGASINMLIHNNNLSLDHVRNLSTHEASGILTFSKRTQRVMLVKDAKSNKWVIPGGKGQGRETAWETALREFDEETGHLIPDLAAMRTWCLPSYYHPQGQYVLFFLDEALVEATNKPTHDQIATWPLHALPRDLHDFARQLLTTDAVKNFLVAE
jgi:8-oxo-dGTP pyrophosphatase MutT (NUDIX family)